MAPRLGDPISGLEAAAAEPGVTLFSAGIGAEGQTAGGRVLNVTAMGTTIGAARQQAYEAISHISWPGMHYRRDIGEAAAAVEEVPA
jgi:phosphoribosylamine--glycine ligase